MLHALDKTSPFPPITSLQPPQFQEFTNSFAPRRRFNFPIISNFRTLSVVMGVVPCSSPEAAQIALSSLECAVAQLKPPKSFTIRTYENPGGGGIANTTERKNTAGYRECS